MVWDSACLRYRFNKLTMSSIHHTQQSHNLQPSHCNWRQTYVTSQQHQSVAGICITVSRSFWEAEHHTAISRNSHSSATNITTIVGLMCHLSQSVWTACTLTFSLCGNHKTSLIKSLHFKVHRIFWNSCQGVTICSGTIYGRQQSTVVTPPCVWLILEHQVRGLVM